MSLPVLALLALTARAEDLLSLEGTVAAAKVASGAPVDLTVTLTAPTGWTVALQPPAAPGLSVTPTAAEAPLGLDDRERRVFHYTLSGPDGSYILQPGAARATPPGSDTPQEVSAPPLFVDIGVAGPTGGDMAEFEAPPPPEEGIDGRRLALVGGGVLLGAGLLGGGVWLWRQRSRSGGAGASAAAVARQRWRAARAEGPPDQALALRLSAIFRDYLAARYGFPAAAATTREVLAALTAQGALPPVAHARLTEVLEAGDRLKYAGEGGGERFFDDLEASFEAVLALGEARDA